MKTLGDALCVLKQQPCGCFVTLSSAKDQSAAAVARIGERHQHPDRSESVLMTMKMAIGVPLSCAEHAGRERKGI